MVFKIKMEVTAELLSSKLKLSMMHRIGNHNNLTVKCEIKKFKWLSTYISHNKIFFITLKSFDVKYSNKFRNTVSFGLVNCKTL